MSETQAQRTWSGTPRWAKWLLGVSLALNFIVIGLAAGAAIRFHQHGHSHGGVATIGQIMWALPKESRDRAKDLLRAARPDLKSLRAERKAAKHAVADAIEMNPFDADAVKSAFAELRAKDQSAKASTHDVMINILQVLTPEERADVARSLRKQRRWRK